jgi:hypothetical protein
VDGPIEAEIPLISVSIRALGVQYDAHGVSGASRWQLCLGKPFGKAERVAFRASIYKQFGGTQ